MKLTLARPEHAEMVSGFYRSLHGAEFAHQEMFSAQIVEQLLRDEELAVVIASHGQRILGCGLAFLLPWNQSLEIGALSVLDHIEHRGEVGKALFEALRRLGMKSYGVVYFRSRTESSFRRGRSIGASCWGYRPAPGSNNVEDAELIVGFYNAVGLAERAEPPQNIITQMPFAAQILSGLERGTRGLPYPKSFPVGRPRGTGAVVISGRVWPTYHSRGNYIIIENAAGNYPIQVIREFVDTVRKKGVRDIRLTLPVSQDEAFVELLSIGFKPVAYLPGWFLRGAHRFDCIELVTTTPRTNPGDPSFLNRAVSRIDEGLTPNF